jgi:hypothetical protein
VNTVVVVVVVVMVMVYVLHFCDIKNTVRPRSHWHAAVLVELIYPGYVDSTEGY